MMTPNPAALDHASQCAGEYLDSLGRYDLSQLSPNEWRQLVQIIALNYADKCIEADCPF